MTNYQSTSYNVREDRPDGASPYATAEFVTTQDPTAPDHVLRVSAAGIGFTLEDVRGLQAFLNDQFGRNRERVLSIDVDDEGHGSMVLASRDPDGSVTLEKDWTLAPGDVEVLTTAGTTFTRTAPDTAWNPLEAVPPVQPRQCPVIYNGVQCSEPEGHQDSTPERPGTVHMFGRSAQTGDGAVTPPANPHVQPVAPGGEQAAESATAGQAAGETTPSPTPDEQPSKKPTRRKKEEIAYDRALEAFRAQPNSQLEYTDLVKAAEALRKRFPDNSRLEAYDRHVQEQDIKWLTDQPSGPKPAAPPLPEAVGTSDAGSEPHFAPEPVAAQPAPFQPPALSIPAPQDVSPEESAAAQAFPCQHISDVSGRPCIRAAGHELTNPPKPHIYAPLPDGQSLPVPAFVPPLPPQPETPALSQQGFASWPVGQPVVDGQGFTQAPIPPFQIPQPTAETQGQQLLSFQVPPTPQGAELQPPAPAAPPWGQQ
jgi:hypothetical protein